MNTKLPVSISRARIQLMLKHNYLASAAAHLKFYCTEESWCKTMATDGFNIFVNEIFVKTLNEEEIIGVIAHEIMHCVLGHIDRKQNRNSVVWNIAIDCATNLLLVEAGIVLPKGALVERRFKGKTAEDIYISLLALPEQQLYNLLSSVGDCESFKGDHEDGEGDADDGNAKGFSDIHLDTNDLRGRWARNADFPTEAERMRIRKTWQHELSSKLPGNISGSFCEEIKKAGEQQINWRDYFSKFMTGLRHDDYRLFPPNKKHIWRQIYLPSFGSPGPDHIVIVVDTSGSMDRNILGKLLTELDSARQICGCKLTLIQCDYEIKKVDVYESWDLLDYEFDMMKFYGRGGTSFVPPFEWIDKFVMEGNQIPDAIIYMTDGFGDFPKELPEFPCLWIVPENANKKFPFGELMSIRHIN